MDKKGSEGRVKGKYIVSALCVLGAFLILVASADAQTIEGNREVIDTQRVYVNAPHLIFPWSDAAEYQFMSKEFSGDIDFMVGFDSELIKPKSAELLRDGDWVDVSSSFDSIDYEYQGMNKWYYTQNVGIVEDQLYNFRIKYDFIGHGSGKYWVCAKPSMQTLQQAISAGNFLCLDPLWNGTYNYRFPIWGYDAGLNSLVTGMIPVNVTMNSSVEQFWCEWGYNSTNRTIGYVYWNNYTDYICVDDDEITAVTTFIEKGNGTDYGDAWGDYDVVFLVNMTTGTIIYDESGHSRHGTIAGTGAPVYNGFIANGWNMTADNTKVDLPAIAGTMFTGYISIWFMPDETMSSVAGIANGDDRGYRFNGGVPGDVYFQKTTGTLRGDGFCSSGDLASTTTLWTKGNKYNIIYAWNETEVSLWVNGVQEASCLPKKSGATLNRTSLTSLAIGYRAGGSWPGTARGTYDNFMAKSNISISNDEIRFIYSSQLNYFPYGALDLNLTAPVTPNATNITLDYTIQYCYNDDYLYVRERGTNQSGFFFDEYLQFCEYGCSNETFMNLGRPGCKESDMEMALITVFIMIGVFSLIAWVVKK